MKTMKFIQVVPRFGANHPNNGYLRGKSLTGQTIKHPPVLTMYATEAGVVVTPELEAQCKLRGCEFRADVVIGLDQLKELNRQPSLISATEVEIEVDATDGAPATGAAASTNGKPLGKYTKAELHAKCGELGLVFDETATNAQLVGLIEARLAE